MARIAVVGGGIGGLTTALGLARAGHPVTVVERDDLPLHADPAEAFAATRRGIPQLQQTHGFLARIVLTLREHFPDVLDEILAAGSQVLPMAERLADHRDDDDELITLVTRRTTVDWALRRAVQAEHGIELRTGAGVESLIAQPGAHGAPHVTGIRLDDGTSLEVGAVVAATGKRGPVPQWLAELGADVPERTHQSGLMYLTRWYRNPNGVQLGRDVRIAGDHDFVKYLAIPADGDTFSITLAVHVDDAEIRGLLSDPERFHAAAAMMEGPAWFLGQDGAVPASDVLPMGGLINRLRSFLDPEGRPLVTGFHALGDAHTCTNPLYGRGCSLAVVQAVALTQAFVAHPHDAEARAVAYEGACERDVTPWFELSVQADAMGADPGGKAIRETGHHRTGTPADDAHHALAKVMSAAEREPAIGRGFMRVMNLLATPSDLMADPVFLERAMTVLANPDDYPEPAPPAGPTRTDLLESLAPPSPLSA